MQDRYVGDIGDFGKFALLRALTHGNSFHLGVVWCLFPDEIHNGDGRHLAYLERADFSALEPSLHAALKDLVKGTRRSLASVEAAGILPGGTSYFRKSTLRDAPMGSTGLSRVTHRRKWRDRALAATKAADVVFFDPDNGIETPSISETHPKSGKYVFWDDLTPFWERGQSLVVYHHLNRTASAVVQTQVLRTRFAERLGQIPFLAPLLFRRGSCRHFWIIGQSSHAARIEELVTRFLAGGWEQHFDPKWRGQLIET